VIPSTSYLLSVAGLGVSLAGFSGLVAAFRRGATWQRIDAYRLRQIPEMGLAASFLAFVTLPLADTVHDPATVLRIAAGAGLLFSVLHMLALLLRMRRLEIHLSGPRWAVVVIVDLVVVLTGADALGSATVAAYEWLLAVMLARPMLAFVLVLADVAEA
jgi:hypothetical protein